MFGVLLVADASAEVYRWTDENGKVYYGDRAPKQVEADDVTEQIRQVNVDASQAEQQRLDHLFPRNRAPTSEQERLRHRADEREMAQRDACNKLKQQLNGYRSGPFYLVDEKGNRSVISSKERDRRIAMMEDSIRKNCE